MKVPAESLRGREEENRHELCGKRFLSKEKSSEFLVVGVNGILAYGWESSTGEEVWTWYVSTEFYDSSVWVEI